MVAVGGCALGGGLFAGSCAIADAEVVLVDLRIRGCPPRPTELLALLETGADASTS